MPHAEARRTASSPPPCEAWPAGRPRLPSRGEDACTRDVDSPSQIWATSPHARSNLLMAPALAWLTALMVVPCALVLALAFFRRGIYGGVDYTFTLENFALVFDPLYAGIFLNSARIAGIATLIAALIGYPPPTRSPPRRARLQPLLLFFAVLPFWSNYLIRTYAWIVLLNREGLITQLLRWFGYRGEPPSLLYTEGAVIVGLVYNYLPFVILACFALAVAAQPGARTRPRAISAPRRFTTFRRVTLPLTLPGIAAGAVFVFVLSIGNFVTPALLGGGRFQMIGNLVYDQFLTANDWPFGAALSMVLIAHDDAAADAPGDAPPTALSGEPPTSRGGDDG